MQIYRGYALLIHIYVHWLSLYCKYYQYTTFISLWRKPIKKILYSILIRWIKSNKHKRIVIIFKVNRNIAKVIIGVSGRYLLPSSTPYFIWSSRKAGWFEFYYFYYKNKIVKNSVLFKYMYILREKNIVRVICDPIYSSKCKRI